MTPEEGLSYLTQMQFDKIVPDDYNMAASLGGFTYGVTAEEMAGASAPWKTEACTGNRTVLSEWRIWPGKTSTQEGSRRRFIPADGGRDGRRYEGRYIEGNRPGNGLEERD